MRGGFRLNRSVAASFVWRCLRGSTVSTHPYQPSPKGLSGRPAHRPFRGLLGVHSRYGLHTRAVTVYRDTLTQGFSHFVTSTAAPVASGWSGCRVGVAPTGKVPPFHGAHPHRTSDRLSNLIKSTLPDDPDDQQRADDERTRGSQQCPFQAVQGSGHRALPRLPRGLARNFAGCFSAALACQCSGEL